RQDITLKPVVLVLDLDRYKAVNDSVGLSVGDSILLTVSRRLSRLLKPRDTVARIAGDQFGLILMSERDPDRVSAFAEAIRKSLHAPVAIAEREIFLTASIGIAFAEGQSTAKGEELIKDAEIAMYN